ncbi:hypothetical protein HDU91_003837 [Kappamyces sp. JEL0680]|nr:hypothetical protein HDU91_003837 [Kappamyces sp. JEL0680]
MKSIVIACKAITMDCEAFERSNRLDSADRQAIGRVKQQLSQALNNQMVFAKKAAVEPNDRVKEGIEEALKTLTTIVVDLVRKAFLEKQTDLIVQSIQTLLSLLRAPSFDADEFENTIESITSIVSALINASEAPLLNARIDCEDILSQLQVSRDGLGELAMLMMREPGSKALKQQIASASYEIAKFVKSLITII